MKEENLMPPEDKAKKILTLAASMRHRKGGRRKGITKHSTDKRTEVLRVRCSKAEKDLLTLTSFELKVSYTEMLLAPALENAKAFLEAEGFLHPDTIQESNKHKQEEEDTSDASQTLSDPS